MNKQYVRFQNFTSFVCSGLYIVGVEAGRQEHGRMNLSVVIKTRAPRHNDT